MTLNDAIRTLADFYAVEVEDGKVVAFASITDRAPAEVWEAWNVLAARVARQSEERS